jgi:DedD protein
MAKRQMEDEDGLKRQARRRLIGAVALVTAVVVILPMVLDSQPRMSGQTIDLRIPDPSKVGAFKSQIVLPAESAPAEASAPAAAPPAVAESKPQPAAAKPATAKPEMAAPAASKKSKPTGKQHAAAKPGFAVQVGAYSSATAVRQLEAKLRKLGFHVYTEKAGSTVRVRIGPYATRQAAEKDLHKLEAQKMRPVLVTLN